MSLASADLRQLFPASSLSESALGLLRATGCDFDQQGRLTWLDPVAAARLLGTQAAPLTLRELNSLTQGGAIQAIGANQPVILRAPCALEIRADSRLKILVLRQIDSETAIQATPSPANDPGAAMLKSALADKRMCLFRQPIVNAQDASIVRWECLSRLVHEDGRIAQPFEFIPAAERAGLVSALDLDTLELALGALSREVDVKLAVNVSAATIADLGSRRAYNDRLFSSGDLARRLTIEITETIAIQDLDVAARFGHSAKTSGARLALDDFGEGHTSFQSLRALPLDEVKIDGLYIENIDARAQSRAFVIAIDRLARDLGMETVAERVETQAEANILRDIGVDGLQGYYYGRPRSSAD
jgi:EAL domain-containing protein (putative c-di-GMP-specific phosphodiesterase class I)